jgi:ABC-type multidrug transport system permease subunit
MRSKRWRRRLVARTLQEPHQAGVSLKVEGLAFRRMAMGATADLKENGRQQAILQCMTTEHFVLQTARAATIQEANQRANLFLTSVASATIALAFVAQVTQMGGTFVLFSLILLPCLYFIGLVTFILAVQVAIEDMVHARGMARIRHYYVGLLPPSSGT